MKLDYENSIFADLTFKEMINKMLPNGTFIDGYIEAMWFTEGTTDSDVIKEGLGIFDFARETALQILEDCRYFESALDEKAEELGISTGDIDFHQAGIDFWFTRNHHGCGFWDGDWDWNPELRDYLDNLAKKFGECEVYTGDDEKIYIL